MNFVSIDFETANEKRNSPCSIGLVVVKEGKIVDKIH
ncbi:DNA polymerase III subunit epsilon, partial [Clostridium saudiense]|nr:DNA polymerase III subunit epsilon [Clostridium saudiense]